MKVRVLTRIAIDSETTGRLERRRAPGSRNRGEDDRHCISGMFPGNANATPNGEGRVRCGCDVKCDMGRHLGRVKSISLRFSQKRFFSIKTSKRNCNAFLGRLDAQRRAHDSSAISSPLGMETRVRKQTTLECRDANAGEAIPGLLNDIVITHVLRSEHFDDPADLARLPAVSRAMRDAVAGKGLQFEELDEDDAFELGCLSALQRLQRGGRLSRKERLCEAAARVGNLEELKVLRADGWPWDTGTCTSAAKHGHLEVLQWARANGCPWNAWTCWGAASHGHLEVLQWARANGCPWDKWTCAAAIREGQLDVLQWLRERLPVDRIDAC